MRFLVVSQQKQPFPPEAALGLVDAMIGWISKYTANGKLEQIWAFPGENGGGSIVNVDSHEELRDIMMENPFTPFVENEIHPLVDVNDTMQRLKQAIQAMAPGGGR